MCEGCNHELQQTTNYRHALQHPHPFVQAHTYAAR